MTGQWVVISKDNPPEVFLPGARVEVVFRDGMQATALAADFSWVMLGSDGDIVKYRVMPAGTTPLPMTAHGVLRKAVEIMEERGKQYDQPGGERSMGKAVAAFNIIAGRDLQESEGWLLLQILKDVRDRTCKEPHIDSLEDNTAYSALKAEARMAGR